MLLPLYKPTMTTNSCCLIEVSWLTDWRTNNSQTKMSFISWKITAKWFDFQDNFQQISFLNQNLNICLDSGLATNRWESITWTNDYSIPQHVYASKEQKKLINWGLNKIAAIKKITFYNGYSLRFIFVSLFKFLWGFFSRVKLTISHSFRMVCCKTGDEPLAEPLLTKFRDNIWCHWVTMS